MNHVGSHIPFQPHGVQYGSAEIVPFPEKLQWHRGQLLALSSPFVSAKFTQTACLGQVEMLITFKTPSPPSQEAVWLPRQSVLNKTPGQMAAGGLTHGWSV